MAADRLDWLLTHFSLRARAFHAGILSCRSTFEPREGVGYLHLLMRGAVRVGDAGQPTRDITQPGIFIYFNPIHSTIQPISADTRIVCATFEFGLGGGNPLDTALPTMQYTAFGDLPGVDQVLSQLEFESTEHHCGRQGILDRLCEIALILMLRDLMDRRCLDIGLLAGLADERLHKALLAMLNDPAAAHSLSALSSVAGMSRARFAVRFKEVIGTTPAAFLAQWRVGLCKAMLLQEKPLAVIAQAVGYGSASALSRSFTALCGCSPRRWRADRRRD